MLSDIIEDIFKEMQNSSFKFTKVFVFSDVWQLSVKYHTVVQTLMNPDRGLSKAYEQIYQTYAETKNETFLPFLKQMFTN